MLDTATTGFLPTVTEISGVTQAHVFQRFRQEAQRDLHHAPLLHAFATVPFIGEQGVYDLVPLLFQSSDSLFTGSNDFLLSLTSHRLTQHCFHITCPPSWCGN